MTTEMSHGRAIKRRHDAETLVETLLRNVAEAKKKKPLADAGSKCRAAQSSNVRGTAVEKAVVTADKQRQPKPVLPLPPLLPRSFYSTAPESTFVDDFLKRCGEEVVCLLSPELNERSTVLTSAEPSRVQGSRRGV